MVDYCKQCGQWPTHKEGCANQDNALPRLRQQNSALSQQLEELTQERDEWMQQAEHRRVIIRDRKAQVQKLKAKLTRCSAMFDEVENSLADSCRREGKLKKALEKEADYQKMNFGEVAPWILGGLLPLQGENKEDMELCPECGDRAVVLGADYNTCVSCGDEDVVFVPSKDMVLVPREPSEAMLSDGIDSYYTNNDSMPPHIIVNRIYKAMQGACEKEAEKPDLSKCPNCGGLADNGHDRCDPPNAYYCTKCSKSEKGKVLGALYRGTIEDKSDDK